MPTPTKTQPRAPSNSTTAAIDAMAAAATPLPLPPKHTPLHADELKFWDGLMRSRARSEWVAADLVLAAHLCRCQCAIEKEARLLEREGAVLDGPRLNPRATVLDALHRRQFAIFRSLRLGGSVAGRAADLQPGRKVQRESEAIREELLDGGGGDGLLAD